MKRFWRMNHCAVVLAMFLPAAGCVSNEAVNKDSVGAGSVSAISSQRTAEPPYPLVPGQPQSVGMDPGRLEQAAGVLSAALASHDFDGAVLLVARHGQVVFHRAFGKRDGNAIDPATGQPWPAMPAPDALGPEPEVAMPVDGIFDLASMTKPFTAFLAMRMDEDEARYPGFSIHDLVSDYIPDFANDPSRGAMTVRDLMRYASGYDVDTAVPLYDPAANPDPWAHMIAEPLSYATGTAVVYSDLGYRLLGYVLQRAAGNVPLQALMEREIFTPLGMSDTGYRPFTTQYAKHSRFVGNKYSAVRGYYPRGEAIDDNDRYAENHVLADTGLAFDTGCDGLFSTAWDLALFQQMMLNGGVHVPGRRCSSGRCRGHSGATTLLPADQVGTMTTVQTGGLVDASPTSTYTSNLLYTHKGYAWEKPEPGAWPGGDYYTERSYSKTGGAGTLVVVHPDLDYFFILLTNRGYPDFDFFVDERGMLQWPGFDRLMTAMHAEEVASLIRQAIR